MRQCTQCDKGNFSSSGYTMLPDILLFEKFTVSYDHDFISSVSVIERAQFFTFCDFEVGIVNI